MIGPRSFSLNVYIDYIPLKISAFANVIMFLDDTSILISDINYDDFKESFNRALMYLSKWFQASQLVLNVKVKVFRYKPEVALGVPGG
jgi:hypothetical protein